MTPLLFLRALPHSVLQQPVHWLPLKSMIRSPSGHELDHHKNVLGVRSLVKKSGNDKERRKEKRKEGERTGRK